MQTRTRFVLPIAALILIAAAAIWTVRGEARAQSAATTATQRIATIDIHALVQARLTTDPYAADLMALRERIQGQIADLGTELESLRNQIDVLQPNDPQRGQLAQQFQRGFQQAQVVQQQLRAEFDAFTNEQGAEAYAEIRDRAAQIATAEGFTHLIASRPDAEIELSQTQPNLIQEMLLRTVLMAPDGTDITAEVRDAIGIPDITPEQARARMLGSDEDTTGDEGDQASPAAAESDAAPSDSMGPSEDDR